MSGAATVRPIEPAVRCTRQIKDLVNLQIAGQSQLSLLLRKRLLLGTVQRW